MSDSESESNNILHHLPHLALYHEKIEQSTAVPDSDEEVKTSVSKDDLNTFALHLALQGQDTEFWNIFANKIIPDIHPTSSIPIVNKDTRDGKMIVRFKAEKVESLTEFLSRSTDKHLTYEQVKLFVEHSYKTLENLEENSLTLLTLEDSDFIVINETFFVFINDLKVVKLRENGSFAISTIFKKTKFMSPELHAISKIPTSIRHGAKSALFSMGLLATQLISGKYVAVGEGANISERIQEVKENLHAIYHTQLYWCILRCLSKSVKERNYVLF